MSSTCGVQSNGEEEEIKGSTAFVTELIAGIVAAFAVLTLLACLFVKGRIEMRKAAAGAEPTAVQTSQGAVP